MMSLYVAHISHLMSMHLAFGTPDIVGIAGFLNLFWEDGPYIDELSDMGYGSRLKSPNLISVMGRLLKQTC